MESGEADVHAEIGAYVAQPFGVFADLFRLQVRVHPEETALICEDQDVTYRQLDELADRIAAGLQQDAVGRGGVVAVCSMASIAYVAVFIGTLRGTVKANKYRRFSASNPAERAGNS